LKLLVLGANGQIGSAMKALHPTALFLDREGADLSKPDMIESLLETHAPDIVINAAAYTQVDNAEAEEKIAFTINAESPSVIAIYCASRDIPFIHFSTDYVFNGSGEKPWKEDDDVGPLSAYGRTKLAGEDRIKQVGGRYLIFRTSWLYDARGKNFLNTMLRLGGEREELKVVSDQMGAPTYVPQLARASLKALGHALRKEEFPSGVYHLCHAGATSWYGFANAIFEQARARGASLKVSKVLPIPSEQYPTPAKRPKNSRLDCTKAYQVLGVELPTWQQGLAECMKDKYAGS
jgi:dTDP-4-dehydrorhamnose reductase